MTAPSVSLLPCPFCGSEAEIERVGTRRQSTIYQCTSCACTLETCEEWGHGKQWNTRATPPAPTPSAARERIARIIDSIVIAQLAEIFSPRNGALVKSYGEQVTDVLHAALLPDEAATTSKMEVVDEAAIRAAAFEEAAKIAEDTERREEWLLSVDVDRDSPSTFMQRIVAAAIRAAGEK